MDVHGLDVPTREVYVLLAKLEEMVDLQNMTVENAAYLELAGCTFVATQTVNIKSVAKLALL